MYSVINEWIVVNVELRDYKKNVLKRNIHFPLKTAKEIDITIFVHNTLKLTYNK